MKTENSIEEKSDFLGLGLLATIICLVPLIVYAKVVYYEGILHELYSKPGTVNYFTWYKMVWLYILTGSALFYFVLNKKVRQSWFHKPLIAYGFLTIISAAFARYSNLAFYGNPMRHTGLWTQLCYLVVAFLFIQMVRKTKDLKYIVTPLLISAALLSLIGVLQFFGVDYFNSSFKDNYLMNETVFELAPLVKNAKRTSVVSAIFSTFGNSNFVGSYMSMLFPLTLVILLGLSSRIKFLILPLNVLLFMNLVGSRSRASLLAAFIAIAVSLVFMRKIILMRIKLIGLILLAYALSFFAMEAYSIKGPYRLLDTFWQRRFITSANPYANFDDLEIKKRNAKVVFGGKPVILKLSKDNNLEFFDADNNRIPFRWVAVTKFGLPIEPHESDFEVDPNADSNVINAVNAKIKIENDIEDTKTPAVYRDLKEPEIMQVFFKPGLLASYKIFFFPQGNVIQIDRGGPKIYLEATTEGFNLLNYHWQRVSHIKAESIGFKGREMFASGRGYIWSRSLPLLKKVLLIGFGPDTFMAHFPNKDYLGKLKYWGTMNYLFEKPHNLYLQIAFNSGLIALLAFATLLIAYFKQSFSIYLSCQLTDYSMLAGAGITVAILGYLVSGMFYDSVIMVAPVFWGLLGLGIATNRINRELLCNASGQEK
jgi:O-antigen ligase